MTSNCKHPSISAAIVLAGSMVLGAIAGPASADVIVIGSNAPGLKAGTVLADGSTLEVPQGAEVTIMLPSGRTTRIAGPQKRPVAELAKGERVDKSIWDSVADYVRKQGQADERRIGAVRSIAPPSSAASTGKAAFSWRQIPIDSDGDVCIEKGAAIEIARRGAGKETRVTVVDMQRHKRAEARFAIGSTTVAWPAEIEPRVGGYSLVVENAPMRQFRLRLVSPLPSAEETLRVLHGQRCQRQIEAWLKGVMGAGG